ncbi:DUF6361 family protein [uncultured Clostridium sp.]|uniref:DUF6361 family protein n=1 Tax=uncultured Clostridium sp. TaxID=59620 RepID=UPI00259921C7|nr:DUF6361 family protein [uncultured Clostridium sp.]
MIKVGWIDFSSKDREKAMAVIDLMKENGAVDELGIGVVRDRLADLLFPGTSTIQTRAKYFFIVPWCMIEAEKNFKNKVDYLKRLNDIETDVIKALIKNEPSNTTGIIGKDSIGTLKRKPSEIYWNGLRTYNIMPFNISRNQYISSIKTNKNHDIEEGDDKDSYYLDNDEIRWNITKPRKNWKENLTLSLTKEESEFLKEKIARYHPNSLYSYIINNKDISLEDEDIYDLTFKNTLPEVVRNDLDLALNFGKVIHGAHIRYNIILRQKNSVEIEDYEDYWNQWCNKMSQFNWDKFNIDRIYEFAQTTKGTKEFIEGWFKATRELDNINLGQLDKMIEAREYSLKGQRAKLKNYGNVDVSKWVGLGMLEYRWRNVKTLVKDIKEGEKLNA